MNQHPDAFSALRGHPARFPTSAWPWRSVAYLASTVPIGMALMLALVHPTIAEELVASEAAVPTHVGNIFAKLDLEPESDRRVSAVLTYLRGTRG